MPDDAIARQAARLAQQLRDETDEQRTARIDRDSHGVFGTSYEGPDDGDLDEVGRG